MKPLVLAAILAFSAPAMAGPLDFETGLGISTFPLYGNGIWIQQGLPYSTHLTVPAITAGFTGTAYRIKDVSIDWHADYVFLGHVETDAIATTDANYSLKNRSCIGACVANTRFVGNGNINGFALTVEPKYHYGQWAFGVEVGAFIFRPTWNETLYVNNLIGANLPNSPDGPNGSVIHVAYNPSWMVRPMAGASISYGHFSLTYRYFHDQTYYNASHQIPGVWSSTHLVSVTYRW